MSDTPPITVKLLSTGYLHARGNGPCEWAQWQVGCAVRESDFFPEASPDFRRALREWQRHQDDLLIEHTTTSEAP